MFSYLSSLVKGTSSSELSDESGQIDAAMVDRDAGPITISRLWVYPIKSCAGIPLLSSRYNSRGLLYDRQFTLRDPKTLKVITAREEPRLVLIKQEIVEGESNERPNLRVKFPEWKEGDEGDGYGMPGFEVDLGVKAAECKDWRLLHGSIMFDRVLPPALLCPSSASSPQHLPSPSDQFSSFLGRDVEFMMFLPEDYATDESGSGGGEKKRPHRVTTPPVAGDLGDGEYLEYGVGGTGFADKYPMLFVSEESFADVRSSIAQSLLPTPPSHLTNIKPLSTTTWPPARVEGFQMERFRPNVVVEGVGEAWSEDGWKEVGVYPASVEEENESGEELDAVDEATRDDELASATDNNRLSRGNFILTSRCGRCQLPNVDPSTGIPDPAVPYKVIAKYRRVDPEIKYTPCFGVNGMPVRAEGEVRVGDRVEVMRWNEWGKLEVETKKKD